MTWREIICSIFGHKYYVYAKPMESWGNGIRWIRCERCGRDFVINDRVRVLLPMNFELQDMHEWQKEATTQTKQGAGGLQGSNRYSAYLKTLLRLKRQWRGLK